ncbi:MAG: hypothetical protein KF699_11315 [Phycisphaeraceae bacterium]|nr:hypothetical protein [Phycisphaeraceae bacterium]
MVGRLEDWQTLLQPACADLVREAAAAPSHDPASTARLRRGHSAALVALAFELAAARRKALDKFGPAIGGRIIADRAGVEMATGPLAGAHKARRFAAVCAGTLVADVCCGIGGDAMALCAAGVRVLGIDSDPARAWMCAVNAGCESRCADAAAACESGHAWFHLDPARRGADGARRFDLRDLSPGPEAWQTLTHAARRSAPSERDWGGAIKLGPGVDRARVAGALGNEPFELEYLSEHGRMTQAVAWMGAMRGAHAATATALRPGAALSLSGEPGGPPLGTFGRYLVDPDPAFERAGLLHAACEFAAARAFCPGLGVLTADAPPRDSTFFPAFEVVDRMPWNARRIRERLRALDGGLVEVKTRDGVVDSDRVQSDLRGEGCTPHAVFVLRIGRAIEAFITRRGAAA